MEKFGGDKKLPIKSPLGNLEKKLIGSTIHKIPGFIEGYHLTLMTIIWSIGFIFFGFLAQHNRHWLWLCSLMLFLQWFTDSYDGALGRLRDTGIPKWGYYMDHFLDFVFLCSIFIGYTFLFSEETTKVIYFLLIIFAGFMVNSYLSFAATNEFKITYLGFGPTEMRIMFIFFNIYLIYFGVTFLERYLKYFIPVSFIILVVVIFRTQEYIWSIDMKDKAARQK